MKITPRDLEILRRVCMYRFLRSSQIAALVGGSSQHVLRRLQLLYHHGYLERPAAQLDYYQEGGSRKMVYGLAKRGAGILHRDLKLPISRSVWSKGGRSEGRQFLEHALMVSDIMVALELACRHTPYVRFLSREEIPLPSAAHKNHEPFHWFVNVSTRHRVGVIPDAVFGVEYASLPKDRNRSWFFLEADRGTMPVIRENLEQTSFLRKLLAYEATWTLRIHRTRLGLNRFRVLTITASAERAAHLRDACRKLERGQGLFLFTDVAAFLRSPEPLKCRCKTVIGTDTIVPSFEIGSEFGSRTESLPKDIRTTPDK